MDNFNVYSDIKARTNGEIYVGIVGPVRTGKSTFIKMLMGCCRAWTIRMQGSAQGMNCPKAPPGKP